jgi:hypothetical protein
MIVAAIKGPKAPIMSGIVVKFSGNKPLPSAHIGQLIRNVRTK